MGDTSPVAIKANLLQYIQNIRTWQAVHGNFPVKIVMQSLTKNDKQYGNITLDQYKQLRQPINVERFTGYGGV